MLTFPYRITGNKRSFHPSLETIFPPPINANRLEQFETNHPNPKLSSDAVIQLSPVKKRTLGTILDEALRVYTIRNENVLFVFPVSNANIKSGV